MPLSSNWPVLHGGDHVAVAGQVGADGGVGGPVTAQTVGEDHHGELLGVVQDGGLPQHGHVHIT